jgi:RNA polymerase sigma-70 factor (ECF subfamily)
MERIALDDEDVARIEALAGAGRATALLQVLPDDQRTAIHAHVLRDRSYGEIAAREDVSEAAVRKRVSRGLAVIRRQMGNRR